MKSSSLTSPTELADTICAVSTPPGRGGIAVIRVSGPKAVSVSGQVWGGGDLSAMTARTAHYGPVKSAEGEQLDEAVVTIFRAPASYTGDDTVEISVHGSPYIQRELLRSLIHAGARMAQPGEFTRRAFANGRIDLAQAEGVADIIAADTAAQHRLAQSQLKGDFSRRITALHDRLLELASLLELELDFSEEDVEFAPRPQLISLAEEIIAQIDRLTESYATGAAIKDGIPVAIIGSPNAGKSTMLNILLADDRAIVSDIPGTTRDTIEGTTLIDGTLFRFIDTAGLRATTDAVETIGIDRATAKAASAAIIIWLIDPTTHSDVTADVGLRLQEITSKAAPRPEIITVIGKSDITGKADASRLRHLMSIGDSRKSAFAKVNSGDEKVSCEGPYQVESSNLSSVDPDPIHFSSKQPETHLRLRERLAEIAHDKFSPGDVTVTNLRHYESLRAASQSTAEALEGLRTGLPPELVAQSLRATLRHLASITGAITTPALLQTIFTRFCVGK